jgi:hypothetical protein
MMKHTLKTLLVTTLLAAPTTYGANALPTDTGVTHRKMTHVNQSPNNNAEIFRRNADLQNIVSTFLGMAVLWKNSKQLNITRQNEILTHLKVHFEHSWDSFGFTGDEKQNAFQHLMGVLDTLMPKEDLPNQTRDIAFLASLAFQETIKTLFTFAHTPNNISILNVFSDVIKTYNIPQFKPLETLTPDELLSRAKSGNAKAQEQLVQQWCQKKEANELLKYANEGWLEAQGYVVLGYANGGYGFEQNPKELLRLADMGWSTARYYVAKGYAEAVYGFEQNPEELLKLAHEKGWEHAQDLVAKGYAHGFFGFTQNPQELLKLADMGWNEAQDYVAHGYALRLYGLDDNKDKLLELAHMKGWEHAQDLVAKGHALGHYGFTQDKDKLLELAHEGWSKAQDYVAEGYARGIFGFTQNIEALLKFAIHGWPKAQELVAVGFERGWPGFTQDPTLSRILYLLFNLKKKQKI